MRKETKPSFICDEMLWKMARWLRIMGYDVITPRVSGDDELAAISKERNRILLTRDKDLSNRKDLKSIRIFSDDLLEQIEQFLNTFPMDEYQAGPSRCPVCNGKLIPTSYNSIKKETVILEKIPPKVRSTHKKFFICDSCGKVYWTGTHWDRIREKLKPLKVQPFLPN